MAKERRELKDEELDEVVGGLGGGSSVSTNVNPVNVNGGGPSLILGGPVTVNENNPVVINCDGDPVSMNGDGSATVNETSDPVTINGNPVNVNGSGSTFI